MRIVRARFDPTGAVSHSAAGTRSLGVNGARCSHGFSGLGVLCGTMSRGPSHSRACSASAASAASLCLCAASARSRRCSASRSSRRAMALDSRRSAGVCPASPGHLRVALAVASLLLEPSRPPCPPDPLVCFELRWFRRPPRFVPRRASGQAHKGGGETRHLRPSCCFPTVGNTVHCCHLYYMFNTILFTRRPKIEFTSLY